MRKAYGTISAVILLAASALPFADGLESTQTVPIVTYQPSKASKKEKLVHCPAPFTYHPEMDGIYKTGDGVSPPRVNHSVEAKFSDRARRDKYQGTTLLAAVVDVDGKPKDICVVRPLGYGLDENAVSALKQYRFQPGMKEDRKVAVRVTIEVNYRLY